MTEGGVIVVDSDVFFDLGAAIRPQFFADDTAVGKPVRMYLDLLPFLGRHGWRIVIPEMAAFETAGVLLGAPNVDDLFSASNSNHSGKKLHRDAVKHFLERARDGKLPGIEITPARPDTLYGAYLDSLRQVAADASLTTKLKCDHLALLQKNDRKHFGELACLDEINRWLQAPDATSDPVFLLSSDYDALEQAYRRFGDRVGRVNSKGFLAPFTQPALAGHLGLRPGLFYAMFRDAMHQADLADADAHGADKHLLDTTRPPRTGNDFRFQTAMADLAKALGESPSEANAEKQASPQPSRAEQFRQKWNWPSPQNRPTGGSRE